MLPTPTYAYLIRLLSLLFFFAFFSPELMADSEPLCPITVSAGVDFEICHGTSAQLQGTINGNCIDQTITWTVTTPAGGNSWLTSGNSLTPTINIPSFFQGPVVVEFEVQCQGCSAIDELSITVHTMPITAAISVPTICGLPSGAAYGVVNPSPSAPPYSIAWSNGDMGDTTTTCLTAGSYALTVTDIINGCTYTWPFPIADNFITLYLNGNITPAQDCSSSPSGSIDVELDILPDPWPWPNPCNYPWPDYEFLWSNGEMTEDISDLVSGSYAVTVTFGSCATSTTLIVPSITNDIELSTSIAPEVCSDGNGSIDLDIIGGVPPLTFLWSNGSTSEDVTNLSQGSYFVTVSDATGCTVTTSAYVPNETTTPDISSTITPNTGCNGTNNGSIGISISPSGAYTYTWSNGATTEDLDGLSAGNYTITVSAGIGCTASAGFTVEDTPFGSTSFTATQPFCGLNNGSIQVAQSGGTPPFSYLWSTGSNSALITDIGAGIYSITVTNALGCTITTDYDLAETAISGIDITATITDNATCDPVINTGAISLSVQPIIPNYGYSFLWTNGETTSAITNLPGGTYTVQVSMGPTCTATGVYMVLENPPFDTALDNIVPDTCGNGVGSIFISVNGGSPPYAYNWSNGETTEDITDLPTGNYTVTINDILGCSSTTTVFVPSSNIVPAITATTTPNSTCNGPSNGSININLNPAGNYAYTWSNGANTEDLANLDDGTYTVTATLGTACTATASFTVSDQTAIPQLSATVTPSICGAPNGAVALTVTGTSGPFGFVWSNGQTTQNLTDLLPGTYTVTVTATASNCTATTSATVPNNSDSFTLAGTATPNSSCNGANGGIDLSVSPIGSYVFSWSNGGTSEDLIGLLAGDYIVTVSAGTGCSATASFTVGDQTEAPVLTFSTQPDSCGLGIGHIDMSVAGGLSPYAYIWSNGELVEDISNLMAGNYTVTVSGANGCTTVGSTIISENNIAIDLTGTIIDNDDCVSPNGSIDLSIVPSGNYTINWSNIATSEDLTNLAGGTYIVTVTSGISCTATAVFTVQNTASNFTLSAIETPDSSCGAANGAIDVSVDPAGAYTYQWSNTATSEDLVGLPSGTYTVTVTDGLNCSTSASYTIADNTSTPILSGTAMPVTCFGGSDGSIQINVSGGVPPVVLDWSLPLPGNPQNPSGLTAGWYGLTAIDANGCPATLSLEVGQPNSPLAVACMVTGHVSAPGAMDGTASLTASGGTAPYSVSWSPNGGSNQPLSGTTFPIANLAADTYGVTISDANGCTAVCDFTIQPPTPVCLTTLGSLEATPLAACGSGCISVIYDPTGQFLELEDVLQFVLHTGSASQIGTEIARNDQPVFCFDVGLMDFGTTYFVTAVAGNADASGNVVLSDSCTMASFGTSLVFHETPVATAVGEDIDCQHFPATLHGTSSLTNSSFSWSTSGSGNIVGNSNLAQVEVISEASYVLVVEKNGCSDTTTLLVQDLRNQVIAQIVASPDSLLDCTLQTVDLIGTLQGTANGSLAWYYGGNIVATGGVNSVEAAGLYQLIVLDTLTFCSDTATIEIGNNAAYPPLFINPPDIINCKDSTVVLTGGSSFPGIDFTWATINGMDTTLLGTGSNLTVSGAGNYLLIGTDLQNGCTNAISETVLADLTPPQANAGVDQSLDCQGNPAILTGTIFPSDATFFWQPLAPGVTLPNPNSLQISVGEPGTYRFIVQRTDNFCADTATVQVADFQAFAANISAAPPSCNGDQDGSIFIETNPASQPIQVLLNGQPQGSGPLIPNLAAGSYELLVTDGQGCTFAAEVLLPDPPVLSVELGIDRLVELGQDVTLSAMVNLPATALASTTWQPDSLFDCPQIVCLEQTFQPLQQTTVWLEVVDTNGCKASDQLTVFVTKDAAVYVPNAFSPNGDGINDVLLVFANDRQVVNVTSFHVFSRWGESVFRGFDLKPNDASAGWWDGRFRGDAMDAAVFVWYAEVELVTGEHLLLKGDVALVR